MHDRNGVELKKGDIVFIPAVINSLTGGEDCCNVSLVSVLGRRPDGQKEQIYAINTGVMVLYERAS